MLFEYNNQRYEAIEHTAINRTYIYQWNGKKDKMNIDFLPKEKSEDVFAHYLREIKKNHIF